MCISLAPSPVHLRSQGKGQEKPTDSTRAAMDAVKAKAEEGVDATKALALWRRSLVFGGVYGRVLNLSGLIKSLFLSVGGREGGCLCAFFF